MDFVIVLILVTLCVHIQAYYTDEYEGNDVALEKRGIVRPFAFPCNGYDHLPRCLHGGKGPSKRRTKAGRFCVCLCNSKWIGPECSYASEDGRNLRGKRTEYYGPWSILGLGGASQHGKRTDDGGMPWEDFGQGNGMPYGYLASLDPETEGAGPQYQNSKRSLPWVILNKSPSSGWYRNYQPSGSIANK